MLLAFNVVACAWLAAPASAMTLTRPPSSRLPDEEPADDDTDQAPPLTEEIDERVEELEAPLCGLAPLGAPSSRIRSSDDGQPRRGHGSPLDRPPRA